MLRERLTESLKQAMLAKQPRRVSTLRLILAALKDRDIALRSENDGQGVDDAGIVAILQKMVKQRHDSIAHYEQGGRMELAQQEQEEIEIIREFLPQQMGEPEIQAAVRDVIAEIGASGLKDMGRTMGELKQRYAGRMDFSRASATARELLG